MLPKKKKTEKENNSDFKTGYAANQDQRTPKANF